MMSGTKKQIDIARLKADLAAASVELLSAHCATDRVRLQYAMEDVVVFAERRALRRAIASAEAVHSFFSEVAVHINNNNEESTNG